jgi:hypothetical protein
MFGAGIVGLVLEFLVWSFWFWNLWFWNFWSANHFWSSRLEPDGTANPDFTKNPTISLPKMCFSIKIDKSFTVFFTKNHFWSIRIGSPSGFNTDDHKLFADQKFKNHKFKNQKLPTTNSNTGPTIPAPNGSMFVISWLLVTQVVEDELEAPTQELDSDPDREVLKQAVTDWHNLMSPHTLSVVRTSARNLARRTNGVRVGHLWAGSNNSMKILYAIRDHWQREFNETVRLYDVWCFEWSSQNANTFTEMCIRQQTRLAASASMQVLIFWCRLLT